VTGDPVQPARKALAALALAVALFAAVVLQLTAVNRLPLPGGSAPDLVLLLVTAVAVITTPALAAAVGFAGGLAVDIAPPAAHYAGEYALVFCLAAYGAARVAAAVANKAGDRDPVTAFTIMAVAAAAGEAGKAALGLLLSAPDVTTAAVSRVLPAAVLYDLLLAPFVGWLVVRVAGGAVSWNTAPERGPAPEFSREQRLARVFRPASAGAAPGLHLAGSGAAYGPGAPARPLPSLQFSGSGKNYEKPAVAGRVPKLRLSGPRAGSIFRTVPGSAGRPRSPLTAGRARKVNFAGDLPVRAGARPVRTGRSPGRNWLSGSRGAAQPAAARKNPRSGWLGGRRSRTVIGSSLAGRRRPFRRRGTPGGNRYAASPSGAWLRRGRHPWRKHSYLRGGRPPLPPRGVRDGKNRHFIAHAGRLLRMMGVTK
jgi:rod shape-determining protein MreD